MTTIPTARLGDGGPEISRIGLGAWAIGGPRGEWGWGPQDDSDSIATIHAALDRGITWIDTAAIYGIGHAEVVIGQALKGMPAEQRPLVFTKCGMVFDDATGRTSRVGAAAALRRDAENSLHALGVDNLDLLQLHWPPDDVPITEAWACLVQMRDEGLVRYAGVSNCDAALLDELEPVGHVDTVQPPLSLLAPAAHRDVLPWALAHGTGVITYSPMYSGLLTGKYSQAAVAALPADDWRRRDPQFCPPRLAANVAMIAQLRGLAAEAGCTLTELVVAWVLHQPGVTGTIVGARHAGQLGDWIGAAAVELTSGQLARIDAAATAAGARG